MKIALTIAGSDSGGGAGIQADLKTFQQYGVYGTSVIVALTAQNTRGVRAVHTPPVRFVRDQLAAVAEDLPPAAVKTGMLATVPLVELVAEWIASRGWTEYVCDPVMVATSGGRLLDADAERVVRDRLVPLARLVTPNLDEAALLTGRPVRTPEEMGAAGRALLALGSRAALIKGGHLEAGDDVIDLLVTPDGVTTYRRPRIRSSSTHGTGCTLSAAITAGLALGLELEQATDRALEFVHRAIAAAPGLGGGNGPLNHMVPAVLS